MRKIAAIIVLPVTVAAFVFYFQNNPEVQRQLQDTSTYLLVSLFGLYLLTIVALAFVTYSTLRLCKIRARQGESLLLTAYTAVVNFFGPLQSGPAFRAVYLKAKYSLNLKSYAGATLVYYFFWGIFSGLMLLSGVLHWWLVPLALAALLAAYTARSQPKLQGIDLSAWYYLALATATQIALVSVIYFLELRSVDHSISYGQAVIYTGAANLALFVSLTPGAIGFRESFLLFSQNLHDVSTPTIVTASILDRAIYIVVLAALAVFIFGTHATRRLKVN